VARFRQPVLALRRQSGQLRRHLWQPRRRHHHPAVLLRFRRAVHFRRRAECCTGAPEGSCPGGRGRRRIARLPLAEGRAAGYAPYPVFGTRESETSAMTTKKGRKKPVLKNGKIDKSKLPSRHVTEGPERAPHRSYYYAMGLTEREIHQPFVGVVTTWNEAAPCNITLARQAQSVKKGVKANGGTPREFTTITV